MINKFSSKDLIKINIFHKNTIDLIENIDNLYAKIDNMDFIDKYMGPGNGSYTVEKIYKLKRRAKWIYDKNIKDLKKISIEKKFEEASNLNRNNVLSSYLFRHTIVSGEAMSGKTHLLSDIAKKRIENNKPTILIYAQKFDESMYNTPLQHSIKQLGLEKYQFTDEEFLEHLNEWGKKSSELVFFIVDAINETKHRSIWKDYFIEFVSLVKKYSYISLFLSIRDVEKKIVFTDNIQKFINSNMIEVKHKGFEKITYPVLKKFCKVFEINLPKFPFISPIFSNPGLLFLFFETLKRNTIDEIDEKVLKPNFIIHEYIKDRNNHFKELHNINDRRTFILKATNSISSKIVLNGFIEDVKYDDIYDNLIQVHEYILDYLISEGILLENMNNLDEVLLYFSYQRFGNYFIALYLLPDTFSNTNILNKEILYSLFLNYEEHQAVVEALIIRLSENNGLDFIDIFPELFEDTTLNQIRYKCFSQSLSLPQVVQNKLDNLVNLKPYEQYETLELLLKMAHETNNNLNIKSILHTLLLSSTMNLRDSFWSIHIHNSFINNDIVSIIINWALNKQEDFIIKKDSLYLYGTTLGWFLTSSNRKLRDTTTKALVNIFTNNIDVFLKVLKEFESVDDLYVLERLYAVSYGIVLRSDISETFIEFGRYLYNTIFNKNEIVEHILLRDYAKLTVEYINSIFELNIDISKVLPPYGSTLPSSYPSDKEIDTKYDKYANGIGSILSSMVTESGRSGNYRYGDFGRYTFQSYLRSFDNRTFRIQDLSNYAIEIIFTEYILDKELFEIIESRLSVGYAGRMEHKVERIGKKYQWLALYKILAMVSDNYKVKNSESFGDKEYEDYQGTYQIGCRDIDPTTILKNNEQINNQLLVDINNDFENASLSDLEWMGSKDKLPTIGSSVNLYQDNQEYFLLDSYFSIDGNNDKDRNLYYAISSFIVKKDELSNIIDYMEEKNFDIGQLPESNPFHNIFLKEYPNGLSYKYIDKYYYGQMQWEDLIDDVDGMLHSKILLTSTEYSNDGGSYDLSVDGGVRIKLPNKWLINEMKLKQTLNDGEWINDNNDLIFFNSIQKDTLFTDKNLLKQFLNNNGYSIFWVLTGEKQIKNHGKDDDFIGLTDIVGYAYFDNEEFKEKIDLKFKEHK